jgi:hypothetical protein
VKHAKLGILVCGLIGLAVLIVPLGHGSRLLAYFDLAPVQAIALLAAFALPVAMASAAQRRPPIRGWQAGVALAGFTIAAVKLHVWDSLLHLGAVGAIGAIWALAIVGGLVASVAALLRPEAG